MRIRLPLATLALALGLLASPVHAQPDVATAEPMIETVIADQLADFQAGDLAGAFFHASPNIQGKFGTPERFGQMVQRGYPMIWRPSRVEWRGIEVREDGALVKTVLFTDVKGDLYEADYIMGEVDGRWRIQGVSLRKIPGAAS